MEKFKLQRIDEHLLPSYTSLDKDDKCYFFGVYASHRGYQHSPMNQLIFNLKKEMSKKNRPEEWQHKEKAIEDTAKLLIDNTAWQKLKFCTWVPLPPSKKKTNIEEHDDRLLKILEKMRTVNGTLDIRELLSVKNDRVPAHLGGVRLTVAQHGDNLLVDEKLINPSPPAIVLFDDVITTGASFKAAKIALEKQFPIIPVIGIFIARNEKLH